jgi:acetyl-CoA carboxylase alpha subunit
MAGKWILCKRFGEKNPRVISQRKNSPALSQQLRKHATFGMKVPLGYRYPVRYKE